MRQRNSFDLGDIEGVAKPINEYDDAHPDHWTPPQDLHGVTRTRVYHGHKLYQQAPFHFWSAFERVDGKPLHTSLVGNSFTDLRVCQATIDEAIKQEAKGSGRPSANDRLS